MVSTTYVITATFSFNNVFFISLLLLSQCWLSSKRPSDTILNSPAILVSLYSHQQNLILGDDHLLSTLYSSLFSSDNIRHTSSKSQCLTFCSVNATCLSVTYNPTTSTCFTSDKVQVVSIETEHPLPGVFVKSNAESEAEVYGLRYGIAVGKSCILCHC